MTKCSVQHVEIAHTRPGTGTCAGEMEKGPMSREPSYLNEILLFLFSTGDGLFDGFCFSQDSLSFVQFVAALSIRHFLIDSRRQSMGKIRQRWGEGWGFPKRKAPTTVLHSLKKSPICPANGRRHRRTLLSCQCFSVGDPLSVSSYRKPSLITSLGSPGWARCSHNTVCMDVTLSPLCCVIINNLCGSVP